MKRILIMILAVIAAYVDTYAQTQGGLRPYDEWEATQFVALTGHQPSDYVTADNNWEIVYALRSPMTASELRNSGIACSDSQLMLLEVGGIIERHGGKWQTVIPILDKRQTDSLRLFSAEVADEIYKKNKQGFINFAKAIKDVGCEANTLSLMFSYLLDGRMWTELLLFDDAGRHTTWNGCYWILYEPRRGLKYGTNGYGEQDLCLTYVDSGIAPSSDTMDKLSDEMRRHGYVTDPGLVKELMKYGLVDAQGDPLFPVIRRVKDDFHQAADRLTDSISTAVKGYCGAMASRFGFAQESVATVALYHEVMWELMDKMTDEGVFTVPDVLKDGKKRGDGIRNLVFYIEGGLMQ